ncbi:LOW QUALITY PROTEIN: gamma-glutamyltranspeptidase [Geomicrobium sp. JCM 19039]|nr:LOW QUALITY PROTEIN: gamma-glutamyltranspeptidase [Geomicrobium sp. JCM 19039]
MSASHPYAEEVGEAILADGGNAVDAAIAVAFTLGVVEPYGSGIGGGGAMLILDDLNESPMVYDYREMSPAQGQENLAGVPGFVKGMQTVHENYATMSLDELLQPAINYAENGFVVDDMLEDRLYQASARIDQQSADPFYPGGIRIKEGMDLVQEDLAQTMRRLLENGFDDFYTGELANELAGDRNSITVQDLQAYEVLESQAVSGEFNGYTVYSSPPPMSGVTLIQQLQMAETAGLTEMEPGSALFGHTFIESVRETYRDRSRNIGDPTTNPDINTDQLTSQAYSAGLLEEVDLDEINGDSEGIEASTDDQGNTTHFSIADSDGMVVSATNTLSNFFGEGVMVEQGYFLNNHMNNFAQTENSPNVYAGHKRSRSFITPTLLVDPANQEVIGMGSPGGNRIPQIMSQVLIYSAHLDSLEEAMNMPRITHGTHPETGERQVVVESSWPEESMEELAAMGHDVDTFYTAVYFGGLQVLVADFEEGQVQRITDPRR